MKKVIVTGGAGFIGSHTVIELANAGYIPVIVDDFSNTDERILLGLEKILGDKPKLYRSNCCDREELHKIFLNEKPNAVIHFAAYKAVGESVANPLKYYSNNLISLVSLLSVMKEHDVNELVFSSSCTVYGQPDQLPVTESSPLKEATSPYGYTKQVSERMISDFCIAQKEFSATLLRYFNPIGAHPSAYIGELPNGEPNNLVPYITQAAAGIREKLLIFGNDYNTADGTCIRDFIHVSDIANAHVKALEWIDKNHGNCDVFNLGQGKGHSVLEVVKSFIRVTGEPLKFEIGQRRSGDVEQVWADVSKAGAELSWHAERSLDQSLEDAWRWQKKLGEE